MASNTKILHVTKTLHKPSNLTSSWLSASGSRVLNKHIFSDNADTACTSSADSGGFSTSGVEEMRSEITQSVNKTYIYIILCKVYGMYLYVFMLFVCECMWYIYKYDEWMYACMSACYDSTNACTNECVMYEECMSI